MKELIKQLLRENLEQKLEPEMVNNIVYHTSNPIYREKISKEGLIPKQETWGVGFGSDMNKELGDKKAIFASNGHEFYDSTYDDDVWAIYTNIFQTWYHDRYVKNGIYTYEPIHKNSIKLIYKGTGKSKI